MNKAIVGIAILAAVGVVLYFTNIFDIARPEIEKTVNSTESSASNINIKGKDVVSEIKTVSSHVQNVISHIKIKNPYP